MSKKRKIMVACVILLFIAFIAVIFYVINELRTENDIKISGVETSDSQTFKSEYESLNNQSDGDGKVYRSVIISDDNPIKYVTANDIVNKIDAKDTFVVLFGSSKSHYSRATIESMLSVINEYGINELLYVDVQNICDQYELNNEHEAVKTIEGTEGYYKLLDKLNYILDDYEPLTYTSIVRKKEKTVEVDIDEKRIYPSTLIVVKDGRAVSLTTCLNNELKKDPTIELTDEIKEYQINQLESALEVVRVTTTTNSTTDSTDISSNVCESDSSC